VGFVTSGFGLTRNRVREILQAGLDYIGFSIAGAKTETHDAIRVNSHLPDLLDAVRLFHQEKKDLGLPGPKIHFVFLMLRDNIHEVPLLPALAKDAGIKEVFLINICHIVNAWQEAQRVFVEDDTPNEYDYLIKQAEASARKLKIRLVKSFLSGADVPVCSENPLNNLYISVEGEVSPCINLHPPLDSPFKRIFLGKEHWVPKVSFGNIFTVPFPGIWDSAGYKAFRGRFLMREKMSRQMFLSMLDSEPQPESFSEIVLSKPPKPCQTCHKIIGI
jgi:MoaA/NifB/PqqE/SkfB family radical SAM enzyme